MARPIKETPVLRGKDAHNFLKETGNVKKVSAEESQRIKKNYEAVKAMFKHGK